MASAVVERLRKYTVVKQLGTGGMAEVFLCKLQGVGGFEKHVVLKTIRADMTDNAEFVTMFFDEARLAANLNHPNIVQTFEVDIVEGSPFIAMEYVKGVTLSSLLRRLRSAKRAPDWGHLAKIFAGVAAGLDHAHRARDANGYPLAIVHRDISPQNIIVSLDGTPKIFDFGVAKARSSLALTGVDRVKGKISYMAPEQLRTLPIDGRADVFALGVCMYEAMVGRRPFCGHSEVELYAARMKGQFRLPSEHDAEFPAELEQVIVAAMSSHPEDRPTALELEQQLAAISALLYPSSTVAVGAWIREICTDDANAYESYTPSLMTPVPSAIPAIALTPHQARLRRRSYAYAIAAGLAGVIALVVGLVAGRDEPAAAEAVMPARTEPQAPSSGSALDAPGDSALRAYLDEVQRSIDAKHFKVAAQLLDKVATMKTADPGLDIRRVRLQHALDREQARAGARAAIAARDWTAAIAMARELVAEARDDADAKRLLDQAERGARSATTAGAAAVRPLETAGEDTSAVAAAVRAPEQPPDPPEQVRTLTVQRPRYVRGKSPLRIAATAPKLAASHPLPAAPKPAASHPAPATPKPAASHPAPAARIPGIGTASRGSGGGAGAAGGDEVNPDAPGSSDAGVRISSSPGVSGVGVRISNSPDAGSVAATSASAAGVRAPAHRTAPAAPESLDAIASIASMSVDGSLTTSEVSSALGRALDGLRTCYRAAASKANRTPQLDVKVTFEIDEGSRAGSVRVTGDSLGIAGCVRDTVGGVRTRVAPDVGTVAVTAIVRFKPIR